MDVNSVLSAMGTT
ncbi:unnamed protein product, partial [Allacma fusca]